MFRTVHPRHGQRAAITGRNLSEDAVVIAQQLEAWIRPCRKDLRRFTGRRDRGLHLHQPVRVRIRQGFEQHGVYDTEQGTVHANTQREREDSHGGETGVFQELAKGEAKVVHKISNRPMPLALVFLMPPPTA
jgi:hypothetical protein